MLLREPALLTADLKVATRCLLELRIKLPGSQDVSRILMQQPSLLLADFSTLQCVPFVSKIRTTAASADAQHYMCMMYSQHS